jgi:isocitrate dehydrogenase kinase/phosphatase
MVIIIIVAFKVWHSKKNKYKKLEKQTTTSVLRLVREFDNLLKSTDVKKYAESKMTVNEAWNGYVESLRTEDPREIDYWRNLFYTKAQLEKQRKGYI